ncbi:MAG: hypothetical protein NYU39_02055 [Aigarchaeota archaeon]|nr:hypothetical protein [Candidatus Caldarchaeales archaeon]MDJ0273381.1 hypothetical protein [Candidatus Caldarchaeales archaeon]
MSEAFSKAFKHVSEQLGKGVPEAVIMEKMPEFRDGAFVVNRYIPATPPLLGMALKTPNPSVTAAENLGKIERFAKRRGLRVFVEGDSIYLVTRDDVRRALLRPDLFAATTPQLFENIGKTFYNISPDLVSELETQEGFSASIARILADKMLVTKAVVALFIILTPALWIAVSSFLTESLFYPRWAMILSGIVGMGITVYVVRLYFRENFPELFEKIDTALLIPNPGQEKKRSRQLPLIKSEQ